jgi:hypothetical protein
MPIGTRDVVVKHPDRGERRSAVTVRYNEVTTLRLSLAEMVRPPHDAFSTTATGACGASESIADAAGFGTSKGLPAAALGCGTRRRGGNA